MIQSVTFKGLQECPIPHTVKLKHLKDQTFEFTTGINLILGGNATGKTTLIDNLARWAFCGPLGGQEVNQNTLLSAGQSVSDMEIVYDGGEIFHMTSKHDESLRPESRLAFLLIMKKHCDSSGEFDLRRLGFMFDGKFPPSNIPEDFQTPPEWFGEGGEAKFTSEGLNTLLLDEPFRSQDAQYRIKAWGHLKEFSQDHQVIMASHDPLALVYADNIVCCDPYAYEVDGEKVGYVAYTKHHLVRLCEILTDPKKTEPNPI